LRLAVFVGNQNRDHFPGGLFVGSNLTGVGRRIPALPRRLLFRRRNLRPEHAPANKHHEERLGRQPPSVRHWNAPFGSFFVNRSARSGKSEVYGTSTIILIEASSDAVSLTLAEMTVKKRLPLAQNAENGNRTSDRPRHLDRRATSLGAVSEWN
jgi:hypothetical protein